MSRPLDDLLRLYGQTPLVTDTGPDPSFSVVVRTQGRRPDSLNAALDSLAAQTHERRQILVVVHGDESTGATVGASITEHAQRRDTQLLTATGGGRARPLNTGLDAASGDYVCFLDDDDLVTKHWLSTFAEAARSAPSTVIRAVTLSQDWTTDGGEQPVRATGPVERPFPVEFDLLAHMSLNLTPICSVAYPRQAVDELGLRFDEGLAVFEDWEFLMRAAMVFGVTSIPNETSLYRRLDHGDADTAEDVAIWHATHAAVIDRLSARPVLLPPGDARRLARSHFQIGAGSRHETELEAVRTELDAVTRSPFRWGRVFGSRLAGAIRHRIAARRP